ncbi:MAG TPA: hypothetical protein DEP79_12785, partial [Gammaproteobacteria bacterium]|nr:hypothetical protein [Gammaproteobacteria bacterium]
GDVRFEQDVEMMMVYVFHVARGLGCENPDYGSFDMVFWSQFSHYIQMAPETATEPDPALTVAPIP